MIPLDHSNGQNPTRITRQTNSHEVGTRVRANMSQRRSRVFSQKHQSNAILLGGRKPGRIDASRGTLGPNTHNRSTYHPQN